MGLNPAETASPVQYARLQFREGLDALVALRNDVNDAIECIEEMLIDGLSSPARQRAIATLVRSELPLPENIPSFREGVAFWNAQRGVIERAGGGAV